MELTKEYLFLFKVISDLIDDIRVLQLWLTSVDAKAKTECNGKKAEEAVRVIPSLLSAHERLISHFQELQLLMMTAQQKAEDLYLERTD